VTNWMKQLGFTPNERRLLFVLLGLFLLGATLKLLHLTHETSPGFSYAAADSEFAHRSALLDSLDALRDSTQGLERQTQLTSSRSKKRLPAPASINLNTATKDELKMLPGVGEVMAQRILDYRTAHKGFRTLEELKSVKGIGTKTFERLRPYLKLH